MKKANCKRIEDMLPFYLERELTECETKEVEEHLRTCAECRASIKEWERCFSLLGSVPRLEAPIHLWQRIKARLPREERRKVSLAPRWAWVPGIALILVVVGLTLFKHLLQQPTRSPATAYLPTAKMPSLPSQKSTSPIILKTTPQPKESLLPSPKQKISLPPRPTALQVARAQPVPTPTTLEGGSVEDKVIERLQIALLSAQSAENSLERAFRAIQGEESSERR